VKNAVDPNPRFNFSLKAGRSSPWSKPAAAVRGPDRAVHRQDHRPGFRDVFALMAPGYNFDGIQNPGVARLGDAPFNAATTTLSMPNFYGAHGHDPELPVMSATFIAAGPQIREKDDPAHGATSTWAPTITQILGVKPYLVDGEVLHEILR